MGLGSFLKNKLASEDLVPSAAAATPNQAPSARQIFTNRLNKGVNIGGMFVLERWITPHMFPENTPSEKTAELDAVKAQMAANGNDTNKVREVFEKHWEEWMSDDDWKYLKSVGVNAVRVPIGYWNVNNGAYIDGTDFEGYHGVYSNSWNIIKSHVIEKAGQYGIGVLIDLHAVPGGANSADHSGISTASGELWTSNKNQVRTFAIAEFLASELKKYDNVVALQIINEAPFSSNWDEQQSFYLKAINKIRSVDDDQPIVISDGWDLNSWAEWSEKCSKDLCNQQDACHGTTTLGIVLDEHVYRTFSDKDRDTPAREIVDDIGNALPHDPFEVDVQVGEFSCVMDTNSWKLNDERGLGDRESIVREFGNKECQLFNEKAVAYYFWTYKFREGSGGEWGFREMQEKGCLSTGFSPIDQQFPQNKNPDQSFYSHQLESRFNDAFNGHRNYWDSQDSNKDWQHWRFEEGYKTAWADAQEFDKFDHSSIGRKAAWLAARFQQHVCAKGANGMEWVYKEGFKQGLQGFLDARHQAYHG